MPPEVISSPATIAPPRVLPPPPAPGGLPILGHALPLIGRRLEFLQQARAYGPVVAVRVGPRKAYLVNDHTLLHQILVTDAEHYQRGIHFQKARAVAGNGIITSDGPYHLQQRRLVLPAFKQKKLHLYAKVMQDLAAARIDAWSTSEPVVLKPEFLSLSTSVATRSLFSTDLADAAVAVVERGLPILTRAVSIRSLDPTGLLEKLPTPGNRRFATVMRELNNLIQQIITQYRNTKQEGDDLLSMFLLAQDSDSGKGMNDEELRDEVISILLSSAETTALTMSWACHLLGANPEVQKRLQAEVDEVLSRRPPTHDQLAALAYTRRVIKETLRLYPPTYFLSRTAMADVELGGYRIPEGSMILYSFYAQHRDPALFARPEEFDPDRWLPERAADVTPSAYVPFGEGAHRCVGESFAWAEAMTVLATLFGKRTLHAVPGLKVRTVGTVTLSPANLKMIARPRD